MPQKNKNIDGIKKIRLALTPKAKTARRVLVDYMGKRRPARRGLPAAVLTKRRPLRVVKKKRTAGRRPSPLRQPSIWLRKVPVAATVVFVVLAFTGGIWTALQTASSSAETGSPQAVEVTAAPVPLANAPAGTPTGTQLAGSVLFNTPIELLQSYLAPPILQDQLADRKAKLQAFLKDRQSPLAAEADTIAEQPHWKLILAISFAESTLGEHCYDFNCSGIGGSQIKSYKSLNNWILDFNRLLDQHYKDMTLEQMCGVYVQPCNPNWLLATQQILAALQEQNIE